MNLFEAPFYSGRTLRSLVPLLLVPIVADVLQAGGPPGFGGAFRGDRPRAESEGYLSVIGGPGLRFCAPEPAGEQVIKPAVAVLPAPPVAPVAPSPPGPGDTERSAVRKEPKPGPKPSAASPAKAPPPPILPDDLRPQVRPEDFLPFFQPPGGSSGSVPVGVPVPPGAPAQLPPSSATFMQTSR